MVMLARLTPTFLIKMCESWRVHCDGIVDCSIAANRSNATWYLELVKSMQILRHLDTWSTSGEISSVTFEDFVWSRFEISMPRWHMQSLQIERRIAYFPIQGREQIAIQSLLHFQLAQPLGLPLYRFLRWERREQLSRWLWSKPRTHQIFLAEEHPLISAQLIEHVWKYKIALILKAHRLIHCGNCALVALNRMYCRYLFKSIGHRLVSCTVLKSLFSCMCSLANKVDALVFVLFSSYQAWVHVWCVRLGTFIIYFFRKLFLYQKNSASVLSQLIKKAQFLIHLFELDHCSRSL